MRPFSKKTIKADLSEYSNPATKTINDWIISNPDRMHEVIETSKRANSQEELKNYLYHTFYNLGVEWDIESDINWDELSWAWYNTIKRDEPKQLVDIDKLPTLDKPKKIDELLEQLSVENDPTKKEQIKQHIERIKRAKLVKADVPSNVPAEDPGSEEITKWHPAYIFLVRLVKLISREVPEAIPEIQQLSKSKPFNTVADVESLTTQIWTLATQKYKIPREWLISKLPEKKSNLKTATDEPRCTCGCSLKDHYFAGTPEEFCKYCAPDCMKYTPQVSKKADMWRGQEEADDMLDHAPGYLAYSYGQDKESKSKKKLNIDQIVKILDTKEPKVVRIDPIAAVIELADRTVLTFDDAVKKVMEMDKTATGEFTGAEFSTTDFNTNPLLDIGPWASPQDHGAKDQKQPFPNTNWLPADDENKDQQPASNVAASLKKEAVDEGFWIDPNGKVYQVRDSEIGFITHDQWVREHKEMLRNNYGLKLEDRDLEYLNPKETNNLLISNGWTRIGDSGNADIGIRVKDLRRIPQIVEDTLYSFYNGGKIAIEDLTGKFVEINKLDQDLQKTVNHSLVRSASLKKEALAQQDVVDFYLMSLIPAEYLSQEVTPDHYDGLTVFKGIIESLRNEYIERGMAELVDEAETTKWTKAIPDADMPDEIKQYYTFHDSPFPGPSLTASLKQAGEGRYLGNNEGWWEAPENFDDYTAEDFYKIFKYAPWKSMYGGPLWAEVARTINQMQHTTQWDKLVVLIDHFHDLGHNTGKLLDKFPEWHQWFKKLLDMKAQKNSIRYLLPKASKPVKDLVTEYLRVHGKTWREDEEEKPKKFTSRYEEGEEALLQGHTPVKIADINTSFDEYRVIILKDSPNGVYSKGDSIWVSAKNLQDMPSVATSSLHRPFSKKARMDTPAWIDPNGKVYELSSDTHETWIDHNMDLLKNQYKINFKKMNPKRDSGVSFLIDNGWARAAVADTALIFQVKNTGSLKNLDGYVDSHWGPNYQYVLIESQDDNGTYKVIDPFPSLQKTIGKAQKVSKQAAISGEVTNRILQSIHNNGGVTYNLAKGDIKTGFAVSIYPDREQIVNAVDFDTLEGYMENNQDLLNDPNNSLGAWTSNGKVFLDVVQIISDKEKALELGREHEQLAIWDLANSQELYTGVQRNVAFSKKNFIKVAKEQLLTEVDQNAIAAASSPAYVIATNNYAEAVKRGHSKDRSLEYAIESVQNLEKLDPKKLVEFINQYIPS